jgi:hypothetical protein
VLQESRGRSLYGIVMSLDHLLFSKPCTRFDERPQGPRLRGPHCKMYTKRTRLEEKIARLLAAARAVDRVLDLIDMHRYGALLKGHDRDFGPNPSQRVHVVPGRDVP